jgi:hypothetical protein
MNPTAAESRSTSWIDQEETMTALARTFTRGTAVGALMLLAACGSYSDTSGDDGGSPEVTITSPSDGASVGTSFEVTWETNVDLGEPDTGRDHVHVFVDGNANDYTVVGGNEFTIEGLSAGEHTVNVTLQHADHSSAGAEDEVDVSVDPSASSSESPSPDDSDDETGDSGGGFGY